MAADRAVPAQQAARRDARRMTAASSTRSIFCAPALRGAICRTGLTLLAARSPHSLQLIDSLIIRAHARTPPAAKRGLRDYLRTYTVVWLALSLDPIDRKHAST